MRIPMLTMTMLALVTMPAAEALVTEEALEPVGTAPIACYDGVCAGAGCSDAANDATACGGGKCGWGQYWQVRGEFDAGEGKVKFYVKCGTSEVVECTVSVQKTECKSDVDGPGDDDFGCFYQVLEGSADDIRGRCIDPLNPEVIYLAIPAGTPYDTDKYVVNAIARAENEAFHRV